MRAWTDMGVPAAAGLLVRPLLALVIPSAAAN
jgi:hypothetical protein